MEKLLVPNLVFDLGRTTPDVAASLVEPRAGVSKLQIAGALRPCVHWYAVMANLAHQRSSRGVILNCSYNGEQSSVYPASQVTRRARRSSAASRLLAAEEIPVANEVQA